MPPARCVYSVGRSSLSAACTCEGAHVSHRRRWHPCAPRFRVLRVLGSLTLLCARSRAALSVSCKRPPPKVALPFVPFTHFLHERQLHGRANSSQQPTACRSLARRFRGSCFASFACQFGWHVKARGRLSERTLGRLRACSRREVLPALLARRRSRRALSMPHHVSV